PQLSLPTTFSDDRGLQNTERVTPTPLNIERWTALCDFMDKKQIYLEADLTLVRLAKEMGTNRAALSQLINTQTGGNFNQFINTYRVVHAQTLLIKTDQSIIDVALASGFNAKATFNRVFREQIGKTPSDVRKST
ncbi:MAG: helix-turn-helix transcriptional regulator, partial [Pseudomonadota bacterium]